MLLKESAKLMTCGGQLGQLLPDLGGPYTGCRDSLLVAVTAAALGLSGSLLGRGH
jgi:hypothetical protein